MNRQDLDRLYAENDQKAQEFISDIYAGWAAQMGSSRIEIAIGVVKPGQKKEVKLRYGGQKTTPSHIIPGCACSNVWSIKAREDEDFGKVFALITELTVPSLEDLSKSQDVVNGAKKVARSFDFEVNFKESENTKFLMSDDGYARYNPMSFSSKVTVTYIVDLN